MRVNRLKKNNISEVNLTIEQVIENQYSDLKRFNVLPDSECDSLSKFYATCKQHKKPVKFRYITSTTCAVGKPLAKIMKGCFATIQKEVIRACKMKDYYRKDGIKTCWIIDNNFEVRKQLFKSNRAISKANSVYSFDFDTLYTSLPHDKLKLCISSIIKDSFKSSKKAFIRVTPKSATFSDSARKYKGTYILDENEVIEMYNYMIDSCYIEFKGKVYRQHIGIPMGVDPAPFIANLFLHYSESRYIENLLNSGDIANAKKLSNSFRYLDDLLSLNDKGFFDNVSKLIYPPELTLSRTDKDGIQADYLDLDISISTNGFFNCNLFDKRDDFKFKVINYPCLNFSNIPVQPAYGIYLSQLLRICRICSDINNFYIAISKITKEFLLKGFNKCILFKYFVKFVCQYELEWCKFGVLPQPPTILKTE